MLIGKNQRSPNGDSSLKREGPRKDKFAFGLRCLLFVIIFAASKTTNHALRKHTILLRASCPRLMECRQAGRSGRFPSAPDGRRLAGSSRICLRPFRGRSLRSSPLPIARSMATETGRPFLCRKNHLRRRLFLSPPCRSPDFVTCRPSVMRSPSRLLQKYRVGLLLSAS